MVPSRTPSKNTYNRVLPPIISRRARYLFIGLAVGTLLIVVAVILPWITVKNDSGILNQDGFGLYSGTTELVILANEGGVIAESLDPFGEIRPQPVNAPLGWNDVGTYTLLALFPVLVFAVLGYIFEKKLRNTFNFFLWVSASFLNGIFISDWFMTPSGGPENSGHGFFDSIYADNTLISLGVGFYLAFLGCLIIDITLFVVFKRMHPKPAPNHYYPTSWPSI